ncbi:glycosyltransferase family 15 protein [Mycena maculata]|uniref:Glycosyltransferase family 15 protein n=1 Tax=Mycena maculata TaxID=230809 RepID=A0AAD7KG22_9AGAR|nr:glycosyltransferase family 15 protein [Mycena maculata]
MPRTRHLVLIVVTIAITLYYIVISRNKYLLDTSPSHQPSEIPRPRLWHEPPYKAPIPEKYYHTANSTRRASAVILILARNRNLPGVVSSMTQLEDKFNRKFGYPYVFLNEVPFTEEFKQEITALTSAPVQFGLIPPEHWYQPSWIDESRASAARERMGKAHVIYGDSISYRNMCRFQSGFFFRHELLKPYKYYWRVEPDVNFFCHLDFDPFLFMEGEGKKYAFTVALPEVKKTIRSLWSNVKAFMKQNPDLLSPDNAVDMLLDRTKEYYNMCHFWSNFEIADLDLWRSDAYMKFFEWLDSTGGFYYERWGDAPIHTIGAALFARKDQIHFFKEIGYAHIPYQQCPQGPAHARGRCECDAEKSFEYRGSTCLARYDRLFSDALEQ